MFLLAFLYNALFGGESGDKARGNHDALWLLLLPALGVVAVFVLGTLGAMVAAFVTLAGGG